jgi:hypothetical protein
VFKGWSELDRDRRTALENRFTKFGSTKAEPQITDPDPVD